VFCKWTTIASSVSETGGRRATISRVSFIDFDLSGAIDVVAGTIRSCWIKVNAGYSQVKSSDLQRRHVGLCPSIFKLLGPPFGSKRFTYHI
jgi:hypothetical protein